MSHFFDMPRVVTPERMDQPTVDPAAHQQALDGLRRVNRVSEAAPRMLRPILALAAREKLNHLTLLDVACGGGDVPVAVAQLAAQEHLSITLILLDKSSTALQLAAARARDAGVACSTVQADVGVSLPIQGVDVVTNSLFLHHMPSRTDAVTVLRRFARAARRLVVLSDLERSRRGLVAAWVGCRLLSRSRIMHFDGPVSVHAAWTPAELRAIAQDAGLSGARITRVQPWRMLLEWSPAER